MNYVMNDAPDSWDLLMGRARARTWLRQKRARVFAVELSPRAARVNGSRWRYMITDADDRRG